MPAVAYSQFLRDIEKPGFVPPPVMAVAGDEEFMRRDALAKLRGLLEGLGFTWDRLDPDEINGQDVVSKLRSSSLFGDRTAVVIKSVRTQHRAEIVVRLKEDLTAYLERPSKENLLIFDGQSWNGTMVVPKAVKKDYLVVECDGFKPWQGREIEMFIEGLAKAHGLRLGRGVAARLREDCGDSLGLCDTELAKLSLVVKGELTTAHLDANLQSRGADHAMELVDAVMRGDLQASLRLGKSLYSTEDRGEILPFMGLLESNVRKLGKLQWHLSVGGLKGPEAAAKAGYNPRAPQVSSAVALASRLPASAVRELYRTIIDADRELKGGGGSLAGGAVLAQAVHRMCGILSADSRGRP